MPFFDKYEWYWLLWDTLYHFEKSCTWDLSTSNFLVVVVTFMTWTPGHLGKLSSAEKGLTSVHLPGSSAKKTSAKSWKLTKNLFSWGELLMSDTLICLSGLCPVYKAGCYASSNKKIIFLLYNGKHALMNSQALINKGTIESWLVLDFTELSSQIFNN